MAESKEMNVVYESMLMAKLYKDGIIRRDASGTYHIDKGERLYALYGESGEGTMNNIQYVLSKVEDGLKKNGQKVKTHVFHSPKPIEDGFVIPEKPTEK